MPDPVPDDDRRKSAFLTEYRELCERHGFMVIFTVRGEDEYSSFGLAALDAKGLDVTMTEMQMEPVVKVMW